MIIHSGGVSAAPSSAESAILLWMLSSQPSYSMCHRECDHTHHSLYHTLYHHRSLASPHPLYQLLGDLALTNHRAQLILTHKLWLSRLPSNQSSIYNLIGYLISWEEGQVLLGKSLQSALGVWSDSACVRRMEGRQHLWLCQLLVLGTTCLSHHPAILASSGDPIFTSLLCVCVCKCVCVL